MPQDNKLHEPHGWWLEAEMLLVAAAGYILRKFKGTVGCNWVLLGTAWHWVAGLLARCWVLLALLKLSNIIELHKIDIGIEPNNKKLQLLIK